MVLGRLRRSLRGRLVGYFLVLSLLTVGVMGLIVNVRATDDLRTAVLDQLNTAADSKASVVERWLDEQLRTVVFTAGLFDRAPGEGDHVQSLLSGEGEADAARDALRETLAFVVRQTVDAQELMILDLAGTIQVSSFREHEGVDQSGEGYFQRRSSSTGIDGVFQWALQDALAIAAVTPLEVEGEQVGVLVAMLDLSRLHAILLEQAGLGGTGATILVSADHRQVRGRLTTDPGILQSEGINAALSGSGGQGMYDDHEGTPVIGAYRYLSEIDAALMAEISQEEAFAPARELAALIGLVGLASAALLAFGIWVISRAITRPILALASTATRVAGGDLEAMAPVTSEDEVGTLSRAFNDMTAQLRENVSTLERRVEERTAELSSALAAQQEAEARYRRLVEELPLSLYIDRPDAAARSIYVNPTIETMFGYPAERWFEEGFFEGILHPDDRERVVADHADAFARAAERWSWDFRLVAADGRTVWVHDEAVVVKDEAGVPQYVQGFMMDVTDEREAALEIRRQKQYFEELVDASPVAIVVMDRDEIVTAWNPAAERLFGYPPEQAVGRHIDDLIFSQERREEGARTTAEARETGRSHRFGRRMRNGGQMVDVEIVVVPLTLDEEHVGYYAIYHDISELEAARKAAETANQAKSSFLAAMSHEIRTPMNAIIGMSGLLVDTRLNDEQRDYAETIRASGDALLTIINDILDFSKIEAGKVELDEAPFSLPAVIEGALDVLAPTAAAKGIELAYQAPEDVPPALLGDAGRLRQILLNLLSNAVKFTESGEVVLTAAGTTLPDGRWEATVEVRDTGIGIPPDRLGQLFQSFSQLDASVSRRYGGTGLGLAISRRLAELMDGSLMATSSGVAGEGSTFRLRFRASPTADGSVAAPPAREPGILAGKRVLIVDDNATNRRILVAQTTRWAMVPLAAADGAEALAMAEGAEPFDVALLDLNMPGLDGLALAERLRNEHPKPPIPVIILSSIGSTDIGDAPVVGTLTKPVKPSALHDALADALGAGTHSARPARAAAAATSDVQPLRILLAEDNAVNRKLAIKLLEQQGYVPDVATNGLEAVEAVEAIPYDVVLMDVQMPELDGLEATRRIRAASLAHAQPRIVAMTANAMAGDREACLAAGMDDYVSKPIRPPELAAALSKVALAGGG
jgi:PAS domain S-box-containing protein